MLLIGVAIAVGVSGGWYVVTGVLSLPWAPNLWIVAATLLASIVTTLGVGMLSSLSVLSAKPASTLREN